MVGVLKNVVLAFGEPLEELIELGVGQRDVRRAERRHHLDPGRLERRTAERSDSRPLDQPRLAERVDFTSVARDEAGEPLPVPVREAPAEPAGVCHEHCRWFLAAYDDNYVIRDGTAANPRHGLGHRRILSASPPPRESCQPPPQIVLRAHVERAEARIDGFRGLRERRAERTQLRTVFAAWVTWSGRAAWPRQSATLPGTLTGQALWGQHHRPPSSHRASGTAQPAPPSGSCQRRNRTGRHELRHEGDGQPRRLRHSHPRPMEGRADERSPLPIRRLRSSTPRRLQATRRVSPRRRQQQQ